MTDYDQTADALTSRDTLETEITLGGESLPIKLEDITQAELDDLEDRAADGPEAEAEVIREAIEEYLDEPDVDVDDVPMHKRTQLWFGMQLAWSGVEDVQAAMDDMDLPNQGNR